MVEANNQHLTARGFSTLTTPSPADAKASSFSPLLMSKQRAFKKKTGDLIRRQRIISLGMSIA